MDEDYRERAERAADVAAVADRVFDRSCRAAEIYSETIPGALATLGEREAETGSYPPSGHLAPITPWRGDGNHAKRVAADLAARKPKNEGGEAAP